MATRRYLTGRSGTYQALLRDEVATGLGIAAHRDNHYRQALSEVPKLPGETTVQRRMREVFHLHLTRWLPDLLDRKDRLSMAVGLEVRVPFCDHRRDAPGQCRDPDQGPVSRHTGSGLRPGDPGTGG
jgi:asparagine synthase (glutamine-hydrolysing)